MMPSIKELTVPALSRGLNVLSRYLIDAEAHCAATGQAPATLLELRLAPDMLTFTGQIQRASDNAKNGVARLAGVEAPRFPDQETSFPELVSRLDRTIAFIRGVGADRFADAAERKVSLGFRSVSGEMSGDIYLTRVLLPNFYFHVAIAHGILRQFGLPIGKIDYFGDLD